MCADRLVAPQQGSACMPRAPTASASSLPLPPLSLHPHCPPPPTPSQVSLAVQGASNGTDRVIEPANCAPTAADMETAGWGVSNAKNPVLYDCTFANRSMVPTTPVTWTVPSNASGAPQAQRTLGCWSLCLETPGPDRGVGVCLLLLVCCCSMQFVAIRMHAHPAFPFVVVPTRAVFMKHAPWCHGHARTPATFVPNFSPQAVLRPIAPRSTSSTRCWST